MSAFRDALAPYVPPQLSYYEAEFLRLCNPDIASVSKLPVRQWPMTHLEESGTLVAAYLAFVFLGWLAFRGRAGVISSDNFILKTTMVAYNLTQVALCAYMMTAAVMEYIASDYKPLCNSFSLTKTNMAAVTWVFYMSKILDFVDTVFIVVRRKWDQLSFLHVYHHSSIFMFYWLNVNVAADGDIYFTIVLNSFIHLVMYSYYACRTVGVTVPTPIKRMVTHAQRIQFVCMVSQAVYLLFFGCPFPPRVTIAYAVYIISLFLLFTNFDRKTYGGAKAQKEKKSN